MTQDIQPDDIKIEPAMQVGSEHTYYNLVITKMLSPALADDLKNQIVSSIQLREKLESYIIKLTQADSQGNHFIIEDIKAILA